MQLGARHLMQEKEKSLLGSRGRDRLLAKTAGLMGCWDLLSFPCASCVTLFKPLWPSAEQDDALLVPSVLVGVFLWSS